MRSVGALAFVFVIGGSVVTACSGDSFEAPVAAGGSAGAGGGVAGRGGAGAATAGAAGSAGTGTAGGEGGSGGSSAGAGAGGAAGNGGGAAGNTGGAAGNGGGAAGNTGGAAGTGGATAGMAGHGGAAGHAGGSAGAAGGGASGASGQGGGGPTVGFVVSNAAQVGGFDAAAVAQISFSAQFDTDADCGSTKLGKCTAIEAPENGLALCVCRGAMYELGNATITGSRALVILATKDIKVTGTVRVSSGETPRADGEPDGSGGSFATEGGGASAKQVRGEDTLQPLIAGQRGAGSCGVAGGQGGGALQLSAVGTIEIAAGAVVQAGGQAGPGGSKECRGPGGGSGGAIIVEADTLNVIGVVAANGASGSGGGTPNGSGGPGADGLAGDTAAPGGPGGSEKCVGGLGGVSKGGTGGDGAALVSLAQAGGGASEACFQKSGNGGGGGGRGRVRLRYRNFQQDGTVSPKPSQLTLPPAQGIPSE